MDRPTSKDEAKMSATKTIKTALGLRYEPIAFSSVDRAQSWATHANKAMWVVLGNCPVAYVVCPADAAKMERAGYEIA
jgi:hypothetical protein